MRKKSWALVAVAVLGVAGCAEKANPTAATTGWQEPQNYTYTVDSRCGERLLIGTMKLTVVNGDVTEATGVDDAGRNTIEAAKLENLPSLMELLDEYNRAVAANAYVAKAEFDPGDGHPTSIELDSLKNAVDDEACYRISEYTVQ